MVSPYWSITDVLGHVSESQIKKGRGIIQDWSTCKLLNSHIAKHLSDITNV
jgi:hypothetical protein